METIKNTHSTLVARLSKIYSQEQAINYAWWFLEWVTGKKAANLLAHSNQIKLTEIQKQLLEQTMHEHINQHKPLQYIIGTVDFCDISITVRPPTLIPRPETEDWCCQLIQQLKKLDNKQLTILDMCTGSGCIALALAHALPQAHVYAVDKSAVALELAQENAKHNNITNIVFIQSDLFLNISRDIQFDLIVSNPPYVSYQEWLTLDPDVKKWEDFSALVAENNGLALIEAIVNQAPAWLCINSELCQKNMPQLIIEIGADQALAVTSIYEQAGFMAIKVHKDLAGRDRTVTAQLASCGLQKIKN